MKSYVALGFGNNFFHALGSEALPVPSDLLQSDDDQTDASQIQPAVKLLPLHANATSRPTQDDAASPNTREWLHRIKDTNYASSARPIIACGATHTTVVLPESSSDRGRPHSTTTPGGGGGQANLLGTIFGRVHSRLTPQPSRLPLKIHRLAAGRRHVLALTEGTSSKSSGGGILLSWGAGHFGQLGHGPELTSALEPRIVERLLPRSCGGRISDIAAGGLHSLAVVVVENGDSKDMGGTTVRETKLFAWGSNRKSQCGVEGGKCATVPSPLPVVVVKREGRNGGQQEEKVDRAVHFEKVEAGRLHSVGLTAYGEVFTWGSTSMGRCGQSAPSNPRGGDRRICQEPRYVSALKNVVIESIAAGDAHNLALSKNGRVFAWGAGGDGQCGQGHIGNLFTPKGVSEIYFENGDTEKTLDANVKVESEVAMEEEILSHDLGATRADKQIVKIRAAGCYSAALTSHGDVYTWGYGGGLAMGHPIPSKQSSVPMLPLIEGNQYSYATSAKTYPEGCTEADNVRDCVSFDTELNVLMPRRVEVVKQLGMQVEDLSLGPGHMVVICSIPDSADSNGKERSNKTNESALETSDNNQTSDTDEVSSADLGQSESPDSADPPLNDSLNTEAGANTSMTSTAEAASNMSQESVESTAATKDKKRGFLAKMKPSRSNRDASAPEVSPSLATKEKRKSFRLFRGK